ncbi:MAG: VanW family protein [Bacilli bacterium]
MKRKITLFLITFVCTLLLGGGVTYWYVTKVTGELTEYVLPNTTVNDESVAGLTREQLKAHLRNEAKRLSQTKITVQVMDETYNLTWAQLGVLFQADELADEIFRLQTKGTLGEQFKRVKEESYSLARNLEPEIVPERITIAIEKQLPHVLTLPKNASVRRNGLKLTVVPSAVGYQLDQVDLHKQMVSAIKKGQAITIKAKLQSVQPKIKTTDLNHLTKATVLGEARTPFKSSKASTFNAKHGAKLLSDALIAPNEQFSFMKKVGLVTAEAGFVESRTFAAGKETTGIGGGVCQVSTTLYNAVLYADLEINSRSSHSRPVSYVPYGLDAAIANYGPDFRFTNSSGDYIYLVAFSTDTELIVRFYGKPHGKKIVLSSTVDEKSDTTLKASATKTVYKDGKLVKTEPLRKSVYRID